MGDEIKLQGLACNCIEISQSLAGSDEAESSRQGHQKGVRDLPIFILLKQPL